MIRHPLGRAVKSRNKIAFSLAYQTMSVGRFAAVAQRDSIGALRQQGYRRVRLLKVLIIGNSKRLWISDFRPSLGLASSYCSPGAE